MDLQTVLTQVDSWPIEDRLQLMERIWDRLLNEGYEPELTDAQKAEIDLRIAEDDAAPDDVVAWDEVKNDALRRARR